MEDRKCCDSFWIKQLAQGEHVHLEAEQKAWMAEHQQNDKDCSDWMDLLFEHMVSFSDKYDQMVTDSRLQVNWEMPAFHHVDCSDVLQESDKPPGERVYAGHLSTAAWALMMRGYSHEIQVFIIPSSMLLELSFSTFDSKVYPPVVRIKFHPESTTKAHLRYSEGQESLDKEINSDALPDLAKAFFTALVEKGRETT